jgi:hypothetical protein
MGVPITGAADQAQSVVTGALTANGQGTTQLQLLGVFNAVLWGTFVGTVALQCSFDAGTTWVAVVSRYTGNAITATAPGALRYDEVEPGVYYRLQCTAYTSGTINVRLSEGASRGSDYRLS